MYREGGGSDGRLNERVKRAAKAYLRGGAVQKEGEKGGGAGRAQPCESFVLRKG